MAVRLSTVLVIALAPLACGAHGSCPRFASVSTIRDGCACGDDAVVLAGACVSTKTADAYCGAGARFVGGACAFRECPVGQPLDLASGECVPARALREIAVAQQLSFASGERLACDGVRPPVVDGDDIACVPADTLCPRGARFTRGACVATIRCRPGEIAAPEGDRCVSLLARESGAIVVDVGAWARAVFGPDGGAGSAELCAPLALHPRAFGVSANATAVVDVRIDLAFPNNDVADLRATLSGVDVATGAPLSARPAAILERSSRPLLQALQALGGEASAASVGLTVRCTIRSAGRPYGRPHPLPL